MTTTTDRPIISNDSEFDRGIALEPTGVSDEYSVRLGSGWLIGGGINGGLLLAVAGHALARALADSSSAHQPGHPDPLSISAYYLSAARPGPATLRTEVVRRGRTVSTGSVSLAQPDRGGGEVERVRALATYGDLAAMDDDVRTTAAPPSLPPPDRCIGADQAPPRFLEHAALLDRLDLRLDPATTGWAMGKPSGEGVIRGWLRLKDFREPDPLMLLLALDALPPVAFELGLQGWTPTLELTAYVRARPVPGWLRVQASTRNLAGGFLEEDAEVWDESGRLVAQSRQLARVGSPR